MKQIINLINSSNELSMRGPKLMLKVNNASRDIGRLEKLPDERIVYSKMLREHEHTFRKNNSWGLHYEIIKALEPESIIRINSDERDYFLTAKEALELGEFLWFKTQGFERQIFVPKHYWRNDHELFSR